MSTAFSVTSAQVEPLKLSVKGRAKIEFTVTNVTDKELKALPEVEPRDPKPAPRTWLTLSEAAERRLPPKGSHPYVVEIAVPPESPPGKYSFRLTIASGTKGTGDEESACGPDITFEVTETQVMGGGEGPGPLKWILILLGVLVLGLVGFAVWKLVPRSVKMENFAGRTVNAAQDWARTNRLEVVVGDEALKDLPKDVGLFVQDQAPPAMQSASRGSQVKLSVWRHITVRLHNQVDLDQGVEASGPAVSGPDFTLEMLTNSVPFGHGSARLLLSLAKGTAVALVDSGKTSTGGIVHSTVGGIASAASAIVARQDDDSLVVRGWSVDAADIPTGNLMTTNFLQSRVLARYDKEGRVENLRVIPGQNGGLVGILGSAFDAAGDRLAIDSQNRVLIADGSETDTEATRFTAALRPDPTLGRGVGTTRVRVQAGPVTALAAVRGDKFLVGAGKDTLELVRMTTNGASDGTFGLRGRLMTPFRVSPSRGAPVVAVEPDGHILVAGETVPPAGAPPAALRDISLVRFSEDGKSENMVMANPRRPWTYEEAAAYAIVPQPDGKCVVAGSVMFHGKEHQLALWRFLSDGSPDPRFGEKGLAQIVTVTNLTSLSRVGLVLDPDGKILVAASCVFSKDRHFGTSLRVIRLEANGSVDRTFGDQGTVAIGSELPGLTTMLGGAARQSTGKYVICGLIRERWSLVRLNADGSPDEEFGKGWSIDEVLHGAVTSAVFESTHVVLLPGELYYFTTNGGHHVLLRAERQQGPDPDEMKFSYMIWTRAR